MEPKPIQARLAGTDINDQVNWYQKNSVIPHEVQDPLFASLVHSPVQNPIPKAQQFFPDFPGVGAARTNEAESLSNGGGYAVGNSVAESTAVFSNPSDKNTMDVKALVNDFMAARSNGGLTLSMILLGKQDLFPNNEETVPEYSESKYVRTGGSGEPFHDDFYKDSAWISFHSRESTNVTTMPSTTSVSLRKNFHHGVLKLNSSMVAGISQGTNLVYIRSFGSFNWLNAVGLSAGAMVTFNEKTFPVNEALSASRQSSPTIITCSSKTLQFMGVSGNDAVFQNLSETTLFNGTKSNQQVSAKINWGDINYADASTQPYSISQGNTELVLRCRYSGSYGTDNLLALNVTVENNALSKKFFGGFNNLGITAGSYIEITGASVSSNNGIYRVEALFDGIPDDENYTEEFNLYVPGDLNQDGVVNAADFAFSNSPEQLSSVLTNFGQSGTTTENYKPYQYLRLSRNIVPETGSSMTIRNVSNLPILHVKYTQVVNP